MTTLILNFFLGWSCFVVLMSFLVGQFKSVKLKDCKRERIKLTILLGLLLVLSSELNNLRDRHEIILWPLMAVLFGFVEMKLKEQKA